VVERVAALGAVECDDDDIGGVGQGFDEDGHGARPYRPAACRLPGVAAGGSGHPSCIAT
jgi:hypothetical protein